MLRPPSSWMLKWGFIGRLRRPMPDSTTKNPQIVATKARIMPPPRSLGSSALYSGISSRKHLTSTEMSRRNLPQLYHGKFSSKLPKRYLEGESFNFGADGVLQVSDSSEDDGNSSSPDCV